MVDALCSPSMSHAEKRPPRPSAEIWKADNARLSSLIWHYSDDKDTSGMIVQNRISQAIVQSYCTMLRFLLLTIATLACSGCASIPDKMMAPVNAVVDGTTQVPILVATTRLAVPNNPGLMFGGDRASSISYAAVTISVPPDSARANTNQTRSPPNKRARQVRCTT